MSTTTTAATLASYKNLVRAAARIDKLRKEVVPRFAKLKVRLQAAGRELDETMLRLYGKALTAEINQITSAMHEVNTGKVYLNEVSEDEDFVADRLDAVAKLGKVVADADKALTDTFKQAKALENQAEKDTTKAFELPDDEFRELAWLDRNVEDSRKYIGSAMRKVETFKAQAEAAVAAADAKKLEQVQAASKAAALEELVELNRTFIDFSTDFIKKVEGMGISNETKVELIDGARDLLKKAGNTDRLAEPALASAREIAAMVIDAIDVKKALKALGLDAKHLARLTKALAAPRGELEKALDTMVRELKLADVSAKGWIAELRKKGVLSR